MLKKYYLENKRIKIQYEDKCFDESKHTHDFIEIIYVTGGSGIHFLNDKFYDVKKGTLLFEDVNTIHSFMNISSLQQYNLCIYPDFCFSNLSVTADADELFKSIGFKYIEKNMCIDFAKLGMDDEIEKLFYNITEELRERNTGYINIVHGEIEKLFVIIGRYCVESAKGKNVCDDILVEALDYITDNCDANLSLDIVADKFGYEKNYFSSILKKRFGFSFKQLLIKRRLNKAAKYLWEDWGNIDDIINKCGFSQNTFFYDAFQKEFGMKPKKLREYKRMGTGFSEKVTSTDGN